MPAGGHRQRCGPAEDHRRTDEARLQRERHEEDPRRQPAARVRRGGAGFARDPEGRSFRLPARPESRRQTAARDQEVGGSMRPFIPSFVLLLAALPMAAQSSPAKPTAVFHTTAGDLTCELFPDKAPKTVANFVGLAQGTKDWKDPKSGKMM